MTVDELAAAALALSDDERRDLLRRLVELMEDEQLSAEAAAAIAEHRAGRTRFGTLDEIPD